MGLFAIIVSLVSAISVMAYLDARTDGYHDNKFYFRRALTVGDTFAS